MALPLRRGFAQPVEVAASQAPAPGEPIDSLLMATILYMLVSVASINEILPFLTALRPGLFALVVATLLYLTNAVGRRAFKLIKRERPARLALILLAWMTVTLPLSLAPGATLNFIFTLFSTTMALYVLMVGGARGVLDFQRLALWYLLGLVCFGTYALRVPMGDSWRMSAVSGLYDANDFAVLCVAGLPLALHFIIRDKRLWVRGASAWGLYVLTIGLVKSGSRGGLVAAAAACVFIFFRYTSVAFGWRVMGVIAIVAVITTTAGADYWTQMRSIVSPDEDYNVTSEFGRMAIWKRGIGYALHYPIAGIGASNFNFAEGTVSEELRRLRESGIDTPWAAPHNTYVEIVAELGIPGFLIFASFLIAAWRSLNRAGRDAATPGLKSLVQAIKGSMAGTLVGIFFLTHGYSAFLYALLALATVAGKTIPRLSDAKGAS